FGILRNEPNPAGGPQTATTGISANAKITKRTQPFMDCRFQIPDLEMERPELCVSATLRFFIHCRGKQGPNMGRIRLNPTFEIENLMQKRSHRWHRVNFRIRVSSVANEKLRNEPNAPCRPLTHRLTDSLIF